MPKTWRTRLLTLVVVVGLAAGITATALTPGPSPSKLVHAIARPAATALKTKLATAVPPPDSHWAVNGAARLVGSQLTLTPARPDVAGSAFYPTPVSSSFLSVTFTSVISGGSGADGTTVAFIDPSDKPTAVGGTGGGLGFSGLDGAAVALVTNPNGAVDAANFLGVATSSAPGGPTALTFLSTNSAVPVLRGAPRVIHVVVQNGTMTVTVDGVEDLQVAVTLPTAVLVGFTAANGGLDDVHSVSDVSISTTVPPPLVAASIPPPGATWQLNGAAVTRGGVLTLTSARGNQNGSAFFASPVSTGYLDITFVAVIGRGTGADGMTLAFVDPGDGPTSLGAPGGGLGFSGLHGTAIVLQTSFNPAAHAANFVGIAHSAPPGSAAALSFDATATRVPTLRGSPRVVHVVVDNGAVTVTVDGVRYLSATVVLPPSALIGFTAATGSANDIHAVTGVQILDSRPVVG